MQTVTLTKWGNSLGIRIPTAIIKEAHSGSIAIISNSLLKIMATAIEGILTNPLK